jgi:hypothetical protein
MTNEDRARYGLAAVNAGAPDDNDAETSLADVLANLMHHADSAELDFDRALEAARGYYGDERLGTGDRCPDCRTTILSNGTCACTGDPREGLPTDERTAADLA